MKFDHLRGIPDERPFFSGSCFLVAFYICSSCLDGICVYALRCKLRKYHVWMGNCQLSYWYLRNQRHQAKRQGLDCGTYVVSHDRTPVVPGTWYHTIPYHTMYLPVLGYRTSIQIMAWCPPQSTSGTHRPIVPVAGSTFVNFSTTQYLFWIHKSRVVLVDVVHFLFIKYMNEHTTC